MQSNSSHGRFALLITIGVLIGVGGSYAVFWLFVDSGNGDQVADAVAPPSSSQIEPAIQVDNSPSNISNAPELPKFAVRSLDEIASMKSASEQQLALRILLSDSG